MPFSKRRACTNALHEGAAVATIERDKADSIDWRIVAAEGTIEYYVDTALEAALRAGGVGSKQSITGLPLVWRTEVTATGQKVFALIKFSPERLVKQRVRLADYEAFMSRQAHSPAKMARMRRPIFYIGATTDAADASLDGASPTQRAVLMRLQNNGLGRAQQLGSALDEGTVARMAGAAALDAPTLLSLALEPPTLPQKRPAALGTSVVAAQPLLPRRRLTASVRLAALSSDPAEGARDATAAPAEGTPAPERQFGVKSKALQAGPTPGAFAGASHVMEDGRRRAASMRALYREGDP